MSDSDIELEKLRTRMPSIIGHAFMHYNETVNKKLIKWQWLYQAEVEEFHEHIPSRVFTRSELIETLCHIPGMLPHCIEYETQLVMVTCVSRPIYKMWGREINRNLQNIMTFRGHFSLRVQLMDPYDYSRLALSRGIYQQQYITEGIKLLKLKGYV